MYLLLRYSDESTWLLRLSGDKASPTTRDSSGAATRTPEVVCLGSSQSNSVGFSMDAARSAPLGANYNADVINLLP